MTALENPRFPGNQPFQLSGKSRARKTVVTVSPLKYSAKPSTVKETK